MDDAFYSGNFLHYPFHVATVLHPLGLPAGLVLSNHVQRK